MALEGVKIRVIRVSFYLFSRFNHLLIRGGGIMKILYIYLIISIILYIIGFIFGARREGSDINEAISDISSGKYETKRVIVMIILGVLIGIVSSVPQFIYGMILYFKDEEP